MGKEWLYWVGGGGNSRSSGKRGRMEREMKESAGCMCGVYHLFHLHFPSAHRNHPNVNTYPFLQEEATKTRGVEAPRNSLELVETAAIKQEEEDLNFPVGIQIRTRHGKSRSRLDDISSECSSPGTKTPSVVARLMGLDLLPECTSPSLSYSLPNRRSKYKTFFHDDLTAGARSLPETPRVSSSRRSDVERHRLSLQINKDEEFPLSDGRRGRFKHVKDHGVSRRTFGLDITNANQSRRDENLLLLKPTKKNNCKSSSKYEESISPDYKHLNVSHSRLRVSDHNKIRPATNAAARSSRISSSCENRLSHIPTVQHKDNKKVSGKCSSSRLKKLPPRAAADRAVVRNRREDGFVGSRESSKLNLRDNFKSKKTLLSCNTILQVKKVPSPPLPPTILPQEQVSDALSSKTSAQLSSKASQSYNKILIPPATVSPCSADALHVGNSPEYRNYIQTILKHSVIINQGNLLDKWHTPSNPLDPGIFHHLEHNAAVGGGGNIILSNQCNRNLIFQLVDELLAEILTPRFNFNPWVSPVGEDNRFPLVEELCKKIDSFPAANCVVLEDIDSLVDIDLCKSRLIGYLGEEEIMVSEIEGEIVDWLVVEAVAVMGGDAAEEQTKTGVYHVGL